MSHQDEVRSPAARPQKSVLLIGLHPRALDYSQFPGLDERTLTAGLEAALTEVIAAGFAAEWCLTDDVWESAAALLRERLAAKEYAVVMIGAGIRTAPPYFRLFEQVVNLVHEAAPTARLCFNSSPDTTAAAVLRWVRP